VPNKKEKELRKGKGEAEALLAQVQANQIAS
jgi:hypothetical protein